MFSAPMLRHFVTDLLGSVDLTELLIALFSTEVRYRKYYHLIFIHFFDLALVNS
jgi:hypothetical protein